MDALSNRNAGRIQARRARDVNKIYTCAIYIRRICAIKCVPVCASVCACACLCVMVMVPMCARSWNM